MRSKTASRRILVVSLLIAALSSPAMMAGADSPPDQFEAALGPFPIEDNPCTGASGLTLTAYVDVTFHLFTDEAGRDHFIAVWNGTAVTSDGFSGPIQLTEIGQPDAKGFVFRVSAQVSDGTDSYVIVGTSNRLIVEKCITPPTPEELVFAVAYTDVDPTDGGFNADKDVLIAKLIDGNGDGVAGAGDLVVTHKYPKNFASSAFGDFTVTEHTVTVLGISSDECSATGTTGELTTTFQWTAFSFREGYQERDLADPFGSLTFFVDQLTDAVRNRISADNDSPSHPAEEVDVASNNPADETFIDVELNCVS